MPSSISCHRRWIGRLKPHWKVCIRTQERREADVPLKRTHFQESCSRRSLTRLSVDCRISVSCRESFTQIRRSSTVLGKAKRKADISIRCWGKNLRPCLREEPERSWRSENSKIHRRVTRSVTILLRSVIRGRCCPG